MAIPDFQTLMLPLLQFIKDGQEHFIGDLRDRLAEKFKVTEEEQNEMLPSGRAKIFHNKVGWATTHLKNSGLIDSTKRGHYKITKRGLNILKDPPDKITVSFLIQFEEYRAFRSKAKKDSNNIISTEVEVGVETPEEILEKAYYEIRVQLADDLLERVKSCTPAFFEKLVVELLLNMGYGGSRKDAGEAIGKSRDGGLDGIIKEDRLGLDVVYIQAKKWEGSVGGPEVQKFAGALAGAKAKKGVFLTTGKFSKNAKDYVNKIESRIILIDGERLSQLMIDFNIGVSQIDIYEIKRVDSDYFEV